MCIALCHACIIYVHSTSPGMSRACIHLGVYKHHVSNTTCHESLEMTYLCVANEVMKTSTAKKIALIMATSKKFLADYLLKSPSNGKGHHLANSPLTVVINKFSILASPNCCNFVSGSNRFVCNKMSMMDSIGCSIIIRASSTFMIVYFRGNPNTKYLSSKCQSIFQEVVWILLNVCRWKKIWRIYG